MNPARRILSLTRPHLAGFALVALLVSIGTAASLFEPWIYRSIVDDVAGVFVAPRTATPVGRPHADLGAAAGHMGHSSRRILHAPLRRFESKPGQHRRHLDPRTVPQAVATIVMGAVFLVLTRLLSELSRIRGDNRATVLSSRIERDFILGTFRHVLRLPLEFFSLRPSGAIARQIDQSDHVAPVITAFAQEVWPDAVSLLAILAIVYSVNAELALIILLAVPVYGVVTWRMMGRLETRLEEYYGLWDEVSGHIQQTVAGIKTVVAHGAAEHEARRLEEVSGRAFRTYVERNRVENRYVFAQQVIIAVSKAAALLLGGIKALQHQLTPGDVVLFVTYLGRIYDPIESLTVLYASLQEHLSSLRRAETLIEVTEAPGQDRPAWRPGGGAIEFDGVHFGYERRRRVLDGVSFRVEAGEHVGLVGPSGAGKTTLTDLIVGLYRPQEGAIRLDGQDIAAVAPESLRRHVRSVAADGMLFRMSLAENIRYGRLEADDEEVEEAARRAGLQPLIVRLPDGLATPVGERGVELSAGERQRVLLARAFLARPTILLLDEATANLDFRTEAAVKLALADIARGRTTIVVAHRRSMLTDVDRVLVLRNGRIEEQGSPTDLLRRPGYFRDMMAADEARVD